MSRNDTIKKTTPPMQQKDLLWLKDFDVDWHPVVLDVGT